MDRHASSLASANSGDARKRIRRVELAKLEIITNNRLLKSSWLEICFWKYLDFRRFTVNLAQWLTSCRKKKEDLDRIKTMMIDNSGTCYLKEGRQFPYGIPDPACRQLLQVHCHFKMVTENYLPKHTDVCWTIHAPENMAKGSKLHFRLVYVWIDWNHLWKGDLYMFIYYRAILMKKPLVCVRGFSKPCWQASCQCSGMKEKAFLRFLCFVTNSCGIFMEKCICNIDRLFKYFPRTRILPFCILN